MIEIIPDIVEIELADVRKSFDPGWHVVSRHMHSIPFHVGDKGVIDNGPLRLIGHRADELYNQDGYHVRGYDPGQESNNIEREIAGYGEPDPGAHAEQYNAVHRRNEPATSAVNNLVFDKYIDEDGLQEPDAKTMEAIRNSGLPEHTQQYLKHLALDDIRDHRSIRLPIQQLRDRLLYDRDGLGKIAHLTDGRDKFAVKTMGDEEGYQSIFHGPPELHGVRLHDLPPESLASQHALTKDTEWSRNKDEWHSSGEDDIENDIQDPHVMPHANDRSYFGREFEDHDPLQFHRSVLGHGIPPVAADEVPNRLASAFANNAHRRIRPEELHDATHRLDALSDDQMLAPAFPPERRRIIERTYRRFGDPEKFNRDAGHYEKLTDALKHFGEAGAEDYINYARSHRRMKQDQVYNEPWSDDGDPEKRKMFTGEFNSFKTNVPVPGVVVRNGPFGIHPRVLAEMLGAPHGSDVSVSTNLRHMDQPNVDVEFSHPQHGHYHFTVGGLARDNAHLSINRADPGPGRAGERSAAQILHQAMTSTPNGHRPFTSAFRRVAAQTDLHPASMKHLGDMGFEQTRSPADGKERMLYTDNRMDEFENKNRIGPRSKITRQQHTE